MAALIASSASTEQWIFTGGRLSSLTMSVFLIARASSTVLPRSHSVASDELAMALPQPNVLNFASSLTPVCGFIEDAKFKTFGCGSAIASSSLATEWLRGKTVDEALAIKNTDIVNELSLPPVKIHCSVLAEDAIKAAIDDYKKKTENVESQTKAHA